MCPHLLPKPSPILKQRLAGALLVSSSAFSVRYCRVFRVRKCAHPSPGTTRACGLWNHAECRETQAVLGTMWWAPPGFEPNNSNLGNFRETHGLQRQVKSIRAGWYANHTSMHGPWSPGQRWNASHDKTEPHFHFPEARGRFSITCTPCTCFCFSKISQVTSKAKLGCRFCLYIALFFPVVFIVTCKYTRSVPLLPTLRMWGAPKQT